MKALKILGGILGAIVLAAVVFYVGWLKAPDAAEVCDNVARIVKAETNVEMPAKARSECVERAGRTPEFGLIPWVAELKCMRDAKDRSALETCGKKGT